MFECNVVVKNIEPLKEIFIPKNNSLFELEENVIRETSFGTTIFLYWFLIEIML